MIHKDNFSDADIAQLKSYENLKLYCDHQLGNPSNTRAGGVFPCPWGNHSTNKLQLNEKDGIGLAKCFACDCGGSVIDVAAQMMGLDTKRDFKRVVEHVASVVGYRPSKGQVSTYKQAPAPSTKPPFSQADAWACVKIAHDNVEALTQWAGRLNLPLEALHRLTSEDSPLIGLDGKHKLLYMYPSLDEAGELFFSAVKVRALPQAKIRFSNWKGGKFSTLWGALAINTDTQTVIITEGESDALAVMHSYQCLLESGNASPHIAVVAKPNSSTFKNEWASLLKGKEIILTVDADESGEHGARKTIEALHKGGIKEVYTWHAPEGMKDPRDAFNPESPHELLEGILRNKQATEAPKAIGKEVSIAMCPVICLGEYGKQNVYFSKSERRIYKLTANEHTPNSLLRMAKLDEYAKWLYGLEEGEEVGELTLKEEREVLTRASRLLLEATSGRFNPSNVRGMGIWKQDGALIYNSTERRFKACPDSPLEEVGGVQGRIIYGSQPPDTMEASPAPDPTPLSNEDSEKIISMFRARTWANEYSGELLCGWLVCSLLAGVLPFRPHVWVNAPAQTGKSFLHDDILRVVGPMALHLDGAQSSEAGLRGALCGASIPIVWDELEKDSTTKSGNTSDNIKNVLELIRSATKGGRVFKGIQGGGGANIHEIKAAFCLFSIEHSLSRDADMSRFLCLRLKKASNELVQGLLDEQEKGRELAQEPDFFGRLIARIMCEYKNIEVNTKQLEKGLRKAGHAPRACELMATLWACYIALSRGGVSNEQDLQVLSAVTKARGEQDDMQTSDVHRAIECLLNHTESTAGGRRFSLRQVVEIEKGVMNGDTPENIMVDYLDIHTIADKYKLGWHVFRDGEQGLTIQPRGGAYKPIFDNTAFEGRDIVPLLLDGGKRGDKSELGIMYKNIKVRAFSAGGGGEGIQPYEVSPKKEAPALAQWLIFVPDKIIFP